MRTLYDTVAFVKKQPEIAYGNRINNELNLAPIIMHVLAVMTQGPNNRLGL